jgi:hypothetical protein
LDNAAIAGQWLQSQRGTAGHIAVDDAGRFGSRPTAGRRGRSRLWGKKQYNCVQSG